MDEELRRKILEPEAGTALAARVTSEAILPSCSREFEGPQSSV